MDTPPPILTDDQADEIRRLVEAANAAADDPVWAGWVRDRHRLQERLHDLQAAVASVPAAVSQTEPSRRSRPDRHAVNIAAVLSAEEVVHLLGGRASVTRRWLRRVRPLPHPSGRRVYLWGDVLAVLKEAP